MAVNEAPPMPDWAAPDGPWCLKKWLPFGFSNSYSVCILDPDHEGRCRFPDGRYVDSGTGLFLGQGRMKRDDETSLDFYEAAH